MSSSISFPAVHSTGGLFPRSVLRAVFQLSHHQLPKCTKDTYGLPDGTSINSAIEQSWSYLSSRWATFQQALQDVDENDALQGLTWNMWLRPLFKELGYGELQLLKDQHRFAFDGSVSQINHRWGGVPIHLMGYQTQLDKRKKGVQGGAKTSPHSLVQQFLNQSDTDEHMWGFLSNGQQLRVLRNHHSLTKQAYVEFDLQMIFDGNQYPDFRLLWLFCHRSRVDGAIHESPLEMWFQHAQQEGIRALDALRDGVEKAIVLLSTGFLKAPKNVELRQYVETGDVQQQEFYRQVLRLIYRLIFLFVAEERGLLLDPTASEISKERYQKYYSAKRLRELATTKNRSSHVDMFNALILIMRQLNQGSSTLALPALGSFLWEASSCSLLTDAQCSNAYFTDAIRALSHTTKSKQRYPIDWKHIGAEELGSVYESLLELHPEINLKTWKVKLASKDGNDRKSTGSYYTPVSLVECLLDSTLEPAMNKAVKGKSKPEQESALLALRVCDPSCGSGHFLIAAARRLAKRLAQVRSGDAEPGPSFLQPALREVVGTCIYGVDINPMSVELCKVALWMEALDPGKPLSFLEPNIQCGNALLGLQPEQLQLGIQTDYFTLISKRDERAVRNRLAAKNRKELKQDCSIQLSENNQNQIVEMVNSLHAISDGTIDGTTQRNALWRELQHSTAYQMERLLSDTVIASMVWPKVSEDNWEMAAPTQSVLQRLIRNEECIETVECVKLLKKKHQFFHWHLAFPTVHAEGGFDVIIGNPPYLDSEFLSKHLPYQRTAMTHLYESTEGNWDIYIPFTELGIRLLKPGGYHAFVTPNKILGVNYAATLQSKVFLTQQLREVHDFSNLSLFSGASVAVVIVVTERTPVSLTEDIAFYQYATDPFTSSSKVYSTAEMLHKLPPGFISFPLTCSEQALLSWMKHPRVIKDVADCSDGATTGEAYEIKELVHSGQLSDWDDPSQIKLVNTGSIDPFKLRWAEKATKYLGFNDVYPVLNAQEFQQRFSRRYDQTMKDTVVMAGMSKQLEAVVAPSGVLCGKSAVLIQPKDGVCPYALTTLLNSESFLNLYRGLFGMGGMSTKSLSIGPREIEKLPVPDPSYLQEFMDTFDENTEVEVVSNKENRLSLLGKILHQYPESVFWEQVDPLVQQIMNRPNA